MAWYLLSSRYSGVNLCCERQTRAQASGHFGALFTSLFPNTDFPDCSPEYHSSALNHYQRRSLILKCGCHIHSTFQWHKLLPLSAWGDLNDRILIPVSGQFFPRQIWITGLETEISHLAFILTKFYSVFIELHPPIQYIKFISKFIWISKY